MYFSKWAKGSVTGALGFLATWGHSNLNDQQSPTHRDRGHFKDKPAARGMMASSEVLFLGLFLPLKPSY